MANLKLSPPWVTYYREVSAMFEDDKHVNVVLNEEEYMLALYVRGAIKASAISELLPSKKEFGNITLDIKVISVGGDENEKRMWVSHDRADYVMQLFEDAFYGNRAFHHCFRADGPVDFTALYVVFNKQVVQYFTDNIGDMNGICSTLYQEIAKDIFRDDIAAFYCTDTQVNDIMPF